MRLRLTVEVPDIVGEALLKALGDSERAVICPETISPGYLGRIVSFDREEVVP